MVGSSEIDEMRARFLSAALPFVAQSGWLRLDVDAAAEKAQLSAAEVKLLFPASALDMADFFFASGDQEMIARAQAEKMPESVREKIAHLIWLRLSVDGGRERKEVLRRSGLFFMMPSNAPRGLVCLARTSDAIWRLAGDESADFSYYTKRLTLSGIFSESLAMFLSPLGSNEARVKSFIAWRIGHLLSAARLFGRLKARAKTKTTKTKTKAKKKIIKKKAVKKKVVKKKTIKRKTTKAKAKTPR